MGLQALTYSDSGIKVQPTRPSEWQDWVSASDVRNHILQDPLLDWLDSYGRVKGFMRDDELPGYDPRTDFSNFIFRKARGFEKAVVAHLTGLTNVVTIASKANDARNHGKAVETFELMKAGTPIVYQGVLWDAQNRTYGIPDLLVRSDELARLFPNAMGREESSVPANDLEAATWHYRVVDIKFTTLDLLVDGVLAGSGSAPSYKAEVFIYNRGLGRVQGYQPSTAYILGRGWKQSIRGETKRGNNCMERLAPVAQNGPLRKGIVLSDAVADSTDWVRRVRREGASWVVTPEPSVPELRPNMGNSEDAPWSVAKRKIADELQDLTLLWQVGVEKRRDANARSILRWKDPACTATALGVTGPTTQPVLQAILDINQSTQGAPVAPPRVTASEEVWRTEPPLEFYVDFDTVTDLNDDFSKIPVRGGLPMIFMIGCGYMEGDQWQFKCFTADELTVTDEARIIDAWLQHIGDVRTRKGLTTVEPLVVHWSKAETSTFEDAYNSARTRHPDLARNWPTLQWFDFLKHVFRSQPVVVRGALGFGLKSLAQAMHSHGLIATRWGSGLVDGLGAMVGAWWSYDNALEKRMRVQDIALMQEIQRYNEVDCKVMMEIVRYLRRNREKIAPWLPNNLVPTI